MLTLVPRTSEGISAPQRVDGGLPGEDSATPISLLLRRSGAVRGGREPLGPACTKSVLKYGSQGRAPDDEKLAHLSPAEDAGHQQQNKGWTADGKAHQLRLEHLVKL